MKLRPVQQCAEIAGVRAAALCWLAVLKSTRAPRTLRIHELIEFSQPFSQPARRAGCAERDKARFDDPAARPEPARRGRLWGGPTLFKRAEVLYEIDASTGLENSYSVTARYGTMWPVYGSVKTGKKTLTGPTLRVSPTRVSRMNYKVYCNKC